jgi:hypothetical protein
VAGYDASINVLIKGQSSLDRVITRLGQFDAQVQRINATPIDLSKTLGSGQAADRLGVLQRKIQQLRDDYLELGEAQRRFANGTRTGNAVGGNATINQLKAQSELFESIARNSKLASAQFREMTVAASMAAMKANEAGRERLAVLAEAFSSSGERGRMRNVRGDASLQIVQQLIAAGPSITRSEAALASYRSELKDLQSLVPFVSNEFRALEEAIAGVDQELSGVGLRGQRSQIFPTPTPSGPATQIGSVKEYQQRQKYADDLLASQRKLERISVNLDAAAISQNDKLEIRNRLGEAFNAIQQQNFSLSQKLGAEADRYLRDAKSRQSALEQVERRRLRVQELNQKVIDKTSIYLNQVESTSQQLTANLSDGLSPLQKWQAGFDRIEQTAGEILDLSKQLGEEFDQKLKNVNYREGGLKTPLGGGAEVLARSRYQQKLSARGEYGPATAKAEEDFQKRALALSEKKINLNNILNRQLIALKTLSSDFNILEKKGVTFFDEKTKLANFLTVVEGKRYDVNERNIALIGEELKTFRAIAALRRSESEAAGTYRGSASAAGGKSDAEVIETRRNRLLENALSLQGNIISIEGKGGQIAQEKLEIEARILQLKELQNKASQADLQIIAQQIQELRIKAKTISNTVGPEKRKIPFLEKRFGKEKASAISEGLVGGAFPLLFGQGIGASVGGAIGGAAGGLMGGGLGMGLSLLGTSIGGFLDQAVVKAQELANQLLISGDNGKNLRAQGAYYTAELENQVRLLRESGEFAKAKNIERNLPFQTAGDINGGITRGVGMAANELGKAWKGVQSAVGTTLGLLAAPFMYVLTAALRAVQGIFTVVNLITSGIGAIVTGLFGAEANTQNLEEAAIRGTEEYENQVAEINKQIAASEKLLKITSIKNRITMDAVDGSKVDYELAVKKAEAAERILNLNKEIAEFKGSAPQGTSELRLKATIQESQIRKKFNQEEMAISIKNAREIFDSVTENNKRIAEMKKQNEQEYIDMVRQNSREQQDYDIAVARKVQDIRLQAQEDELNFVKRINDAKLKGEQIANEQRTLQRSLESALSGDPTADIVNSTKTAVEEWATGRREVENEYANKQKEIQLQAQKAEIAIQRYKFDNALRIARANEDSQLKISKMQEQINRQNEVTSKNEFHRQLETVSALAEFRRAAALKDYRAAQVEEMVAKQPGSRATKADLAVIEASLDAAREAYIGYDKVVAKIKNLFNSIPGIAKLPDIGPAPTLTNTSGAASAASRDAAAQVSNYESQVAALEKVEGLKQKDLNLAKQVLSGGIDQLNQLNQITKSQNDARISREKYRDLIVKGINPALAQEQIRIEQIRDAQLKNLDATILTLEAYNNPKLKDIITTLTNVRDQIKIKSAAAMSGAEAPYGPGEKLKDFVAESISKLYDLESVAISVSQSIGDAVGSAMSEGVNGLIDGTMTAQEVFANFLKNVSQILMQEATKMIATYIAIGLAKQFAGLFGGGGAKAPDKLTTALQGISQYTNANGNAFNANGIVPFAMGGAFTNSIVTAPTLFKFANGGTTSTGVMGEAGPEAIMPLTRGPDGRLGVQSSGVAGAVVNGDINITVENTGDTLSPAAQKQIAGQVQGIVLATLADQKRGGGMLR